MTYSARKLRSAFKNWRYVKEAQGPIKKRVFDTENRSNLGWKIIH